MAVLKFTKNELRDQQLHLAQLKRYLPTLQLKKAMLQTEVHETRLQIERQEKLLEQQQAAVDVFSPLLSDERAFFLPQAVAVQKVRKRLENVAGVEIPYFEGVDFVPFPYSLFETAPWIDAAREQLLRLVEKREEVQVIRLKKEALEKELRAVSTRVNLFEKILIPRAEENIRVIRVQLSDRELAAVSRAKVAKTKIAAQKERWQTTHA